MALGAPVPRICKLSRVGERLDLRGKALADNALNDLHKGAQRGYWALVLWVLGTLSGFGQGRNINGAKPRWYITCSVHLIGQRREERGDGGEIFINLSWDSIGSC